MDLPTGTVTFLFSDVEGSTALLRRLKDGFAEVLARHEELLREAVEAAEGQAFGTQGDAASTRHSTSICADFGLSI